MKRGNVWIVIALIWFLVTGVQPGVGLAQITLGATGWSDTSIGTWDSGTKTGTLTTDVNEPIKITSDYITLDGNGKSVTGSGTGFGVVVSGRTGITLKNLNVTGWTTGIGLELSHSNTLTGNTVWGGTFGIALFSSNDNTLTANTTLNSEHGIYLGDSNGNTVIGNTASDGFIGIELSESSGNELSGNTASNNSGYGVYLLPGSDNNEVYNNNLIGNFTQASVDSSCSGNVFNLDSPIGGNFWSDWTSPDVAPRDGFVDSPYVFDGGQDNLPWTKQDGWKFVPPDESVENLVDTVVDLNIQEGITNSLDGKLNAALEALQDINEHNDVAAINSLEAFINAVEAQRGNKIADADADALIAAAQAIIATLLGE